ncbi:hypothetical protein C8R46DRAFT_557177 [Mycena filopes]|nr:hypothetical protein C8R46DRAFT_652178 [Mycena filopes]KAJ7145293.1 hypothetical protein C8R46DRAFT_557177 [Mycena filopes]
MHPADAPNTILQLVLLGATLPSIQQPFEEAMVEYGLSGAVTAVFKRLASNSALQALSATRQANTETISPYAGFTTVLAGKRGWDDLEADSDVRVVNFLHCLEEVHFSTYHLLELDTPIESAVHVRTLPVISHLERIVRAILGSDALNSSPGGVLPIFEPSAEQQQLKSHLLSLYVQDPAPLGTERDLLLEMRLRELLNDEVSLLQREQTLKISPSALDLLKEKLAGVLRLTQGRVVCLEITKDVPLEGLLGTFGGYWDATVGRGPKEDRHLRRIFSPQIPAAGDLSSPVITRFIGPYVDFWRIILHHLLYWIHVLLLSRLLSLIRPLIIITQSNPVAATFRAGDLISAWEFLSDDDQRSFLAGTSPRAILKQLPDRRYRQSRGDAFNESLGVMSIVQTGRIKYDPILAPTRGNVDFFSRLKAGTLTHLVAAELKSGNIPPREDEAAMLSFLRLIKDRAEALFDTAGITEALASAKEAARMMEFAVTFLRSMAAAKRGHEEWVARGPGEGQKAWTGLIASPKGEEREHQLAAINERAWFLDSLDQDADPQRLGHWAAPLPSPEFDEFFRGLGNGKDVVRASNAHGRTKQSAERATSNQQGIGAWRKTHVVEVVVDTDAITRNNMLQAIDAVAEANVYDVREVLQSWRMAVCGDCGELVVARHNASYHFCAVKQSKRLLTEAQFPDIERVLYAHDVLGSPAALGALGDQATVVHSLGLVAVGVQDILENPTVRKMLKSCLHKTDIAAIDLVRANSTKFSHVFVPSSRRDDLDLLLTLAIDTLLFAPTHPAIFSPVDPKGRIAWQKAMGETLWKWFHNRNILLIMIVCFGEPGYTGPPDFIITDKATPALRGPSDYVLMGRACSACGGKKGNENRNFFPVGHLLDLPSHFSRYLWLRMRRGVNRA